MDNIHTNDPESHDAPWADARLRSLEPSREWRPNALHALGRLRARRLRRFRVIWASLAAAAAVLIASVLIVQQPACAAPVCAVFFQKAAQKMVQNYKQTGSSAAPLTCEIYTDYECPHCATLYRDTVPLLMAEFVRSGKMRLVHRDYPLPGHPHAMLAARYANAAGELGYYDAAVGQLFKTQSAWSVNGDIESQLMQVLPPGVMQKVREKVKNDPILDATVAADVYMGKQDRINETPTIVIVSHGKRQPLPSGGSYSIMKAYLEQLLAK